MALEGTLNYMDISHLLQVVGTSEKSGVLEIRWQEREARLYFQQGRLLRAESNRIREGIGTLLVRAGLLAPEALDQALELQKKQGGMPRLGVLLCDAFGVRPEDIGRLLLEQSRQIVYDVFSWPGGRFRFQFRAPDEALDRFHHDAVEFIRKVGVEAGLLAREGAAQERSGGGRRPILLLLADAELGDRCRAQWREDGHRVTRCERVEEVVDLLGASAGGLAPIVVAEDARGTVLDALRGARSDVPVVLLVPAGEALPEGGGQGNPARVALPTPGERAAPGGDARREAFLAAVRAAVSAMEGSAGAEPRG